MTTNAPRLIPALLTVLVVASSGCISSNSSDEPGGTATVDHVPEVDYDEDLTFPWESTGQFVLEESFLHEGGHLGMRLQMEGSMLNFRILSPAGCGSGLASTSVSIGASNNFGIACDNVPEGKVSLEIEFNAVAEGRIIVYDVASLD